MNAHDSGRMAALLRAAGYVEAADEATADVAIVNTCEVRDKAEQKMLSAVGRLRAGKEEAPARVVVVACCGAQLRQEGIFARAGHVDLVLGPDQLANLPRLVGELRAQRRRRRVVATDWWQGSGADPAARQDGEFTPGTATAFVTVMTGCDNRCAYCVVPSTRGRERSRPRAEIVEEVERLVATGVREVTLLGQCVNAYGRGLETGERFADLLRAVGAIAGLARVRFMTSHPRFVDDELIRIFAELPQVASHLHLPVQSGADRILTAMRRGYTRDHVCERIALLREARPALSVTTDIIVGFPGESAVDFEETLSLVREVGFDGMFSFAYSERPGTAALVLEGSVPRTERAARLAQLAEVHAPFARLALERDIGHQVEVLVEGLSTRDAATKSGRTSQNVVVNFEGTAAVGALVPVNIREAKANTLFGVQQG